jgi:hypothetical protein
MIVLTGCNYVYYNTPQMYIYIHRLRTNKPTLVKVVTRGCNFLFIQNFVQTTYTGRFAFHYTCTLPIHQPTRRHLILLCDTGNVYPIHSGISTITYGYRIFIVHFFFSSPEPNAQLLNFFLSFENFSTFSTPGPISYKLVIKYLYKKGFHICSAKTPNSKI